MSSTEQDTTKPVTKTAWKKNRRHTVTLPSATVVDVEVPDLPELIKAGTFPNELIDVAISVAQGRKVTREDIAENADFYNKLAAVTVKSPEVTEDDFKGADPIPYEDKEMLVEIATRQRDVDAIGHHLAGLEKVKDWRTFRTLGVGGSDLESL